MSITPLVSTLTAACSTSTAVLVGSVQAQIDELHPTFEITEKPR